MSVLKTFAKKCGNNLILSVMFDCCPSSAAATVRAFTSGGFSATAWREASLVAFVAQAKWRA